MDTFKNRINGIGKACRIISIILTVLLCIGAGLMLISGLVMTLIPGDTVNADVYSAANIVVHGKLIDSIPDDRLNDFAAEINDGTTLFTINGNRIDRAANDDNGIMLHGEGHVLSLTLRRIGIALMILAVSLGCMIYMMIMLSRLMKKLEKCDTPFEEGVVKAMTGFAISLIPYAVVVPAVSSLAESILLSNTVRLSLNLDLTKVIGALVIILLIFIFKYGVQLQKQADETL